MAANVCQPADHALERSLSTRRNAQVSRHDYHPCNEPPHDMTMPLSCYFISSGHNSYLTGNQLSSDGGTAVIEYSLKQACRVIELDVYNQQPGFKGPICKHGGTITPPILFKTCVEAVKQHAFDASPYPVIITIENHTDQANQVAMAGVLQEVLQEMLFIPDESDMNKPYKSPEELKHKIVIRAKPNDSWAPEMRRLVYIVNKRFTTLQEVNNSGTPTSHAFNEKAAKKLMKRAFLSSGLPAKPLDDMSRYSRRSFSSAASSSLSSGDPSSPDSWSLSSLLCEDGSNMSPPVHGYKLKAQTLDTDKKVPDEESTSLEAVCTVNSLGDAYAYTCRHLMRVYPSAFRINSSNFNPMKGWSVGASIVALNWQTYDKPMWMNKAMFSQNNGCGYVLKPAWMRSLAHNLGPCPAIPGNPLPTRNPLRLQLTLHSAYCKQSSRSFLGKPWLKPDLFVQMYVYGVPIDWQTQKTPTVQGSDNMTVDKKYHFMVHFPEIAILVIILWDKEIAAKADAVLGHWETPLATLRQGDFKVQLTDRKGRVKQDRWIKVNFEWQTEDSSVPDGPDDFYQSHTSYNLAQPLLCTELEDDAVAFMNKPVAVSVDNVTKSQGFLRFGRSSFSLR